MNPANTVTVANGVILYSAFAWKIYQVCRAPHDVSLRIVTLCLGFGALAYPLEALLGHDVLAQKTAGPIRLVWAHEVFLQSLICSLICFFLFSALDGAPAEIRARREVLALVITLAITTVAMLVSRGHDVKPTFVIFLAGDLYTVYGFTIASIWALRYRRNAGRRLRRGLLLTAIGLVTMTMSAALLVGVVSLRWLTGSTPVKLSLVQSILLLPGIAIFVVGVTYPGAAMRLAALRVWWRHYHTYRDLAPLWTALHRNFPEDALHRVPRLRWLDAISVRGVHHRYYRRVIECRDGLVRLSPYLTASAHHGNGEIPLAEQVRDALRRRHSTDTVASAPIGPIAAPHDSSLESDAKELVALSHALTAK